jgi:hypothetical protein
MQTNAQAQIILLPSRREPRPLPTRHELIEIEAELSTTEMQAIRARLARFEHQQ